MRTTRIVAGEYVDAYVQAVKEAGNLWGLPVIDFNSVTGMNPMIEEQLIYFYDRVSIVCTLTRKGRSVWHVH